MLWEYAMRREHENIRPGHVRRVRRAERRERMRELIEAGPVKSSNGRLMLRLTLLVLLVLAGTWVATQLASAL